VLARLDQGIAAIKSFGAEALGVVPWALDMAADDPLAAVKVYPKAFQKWPPDSTRPWPAPPVLLVQEAAIWGHRWRSIPIPSSHLPQICLLNNGAHTRKVRMRLDHPAHKRYYTACASDIDLHPLPVRTCFAIQEASCELGHVAYLPSYLQIGAA